MNKKLKHVYRIIGLQEYSTMSQSPAASYDSSDSNHISQSLTASHYYSDSNQPPQFSYYKSRSSI